MENLKITEDLSTNFPIDLVYMKREQIQNFYSKNHGHSHDNNQHGHSHNQNQHGHSHNGKPCDGNHGKIQQKPHPNQKVHSHKVPSHHNEHNDEDYDDEEHHGHSHDNKNHGHSHSHNQKGHSHKEHNDDEECDDEEHHGHSHDNKNHGHSHNHNQHGHSHNQNQHGHSHNGKPCDGNHGQQHGHSHEKTPQHGHSHNQNQHGHSHNGKPCDGNHKNPILFNLIKLSTSAFLGISKLKNYLSHEKKKTEFENWWNEQKQNNIAKDLIEERVQSIMESSLKTTEMDKSDLIDLAPELFDVPALLGEKKDEKIEDSKSYFGDMISLINYFIKFNDECRKFTEGQGSRLTESLFRVLCFCALVIPLIEKATGEALLPNKTVKKNFNSKCEKHQEKYLVHPYTSEWTCFQCYPPNEELKIVNYFFNIQNQLRNSIAQVSGMESLCFDPRCEHCPSFVNLGFHESRGIMRYMSDNHKVICRGCGKKTGELKCGLLVVEINQKHSNTCKDKRYQQKVPSSTCGCKVHTSYYLICSLKCHKKVKLPEYEQTKTLYSQASQKIVVYSSGPLVLGCFHYNEQDQLIEFEISPINNNQLETVCHVCGKSDTKSCSRCKSTFYCSTDCQKKDWPNHKLICKQN